MHKQFVRWRFRLHCHSRFGACDDGSVCTLNDFCQNSACVSGGGLSCDPNADDCLVFGCDPVNGCDTVGSFKAAGTSCFDGDACTSNDVCSGGSETCQGTPVTCDDENPCTTDACVAGLGCTYNSNPCDDGSACTTGDACLDGSCTGATVDCSDGNSCTLNTCDAENGCETDVLFNQPVMTETPAPPETCAKERPATVPGLWRVMTEMCARQTSAPAKRLPSLRRAL